MDESSPCYRSLFLLGSLHGASHLAHPQHLMGSTPGAFVPEARGGASSCSQDELGTRSLNRTALNSTVLTKLQIPENGEKTNPSSISNRLAQLPWDN